MTVPDATGRIRVVVFDLGGVLLDWNPRYLYRKLFGGDEVAMERFLAEVCTIEWHRAHDLGAPPERTCTQLAQAHPEQAELIWAWSQRSEEMIAGPIDGSVRLLGELKAEGVPCYALTNMERETYPLRRERFPFLGWFDGTIVSAVEGVAKPDPAIFELLLDRFDLTPSETLFVDDSADNVQAAKRLGMHAIEFRSPDRLRATLAEAGLLPGVSPPGPSSSSAGPSRSRGRRTAASDPA
jgi:2-haloacid dehalogenase